MSKKLYKILSDVCTYHLNYRYYYLLKLIKLCIFIYDRIPLHKHFIVIDFNLKLVRMDTFFCIKLYYLLIIYLLIFYIVSFIEKRSVFIFIFKRFL